MKQKTESYVCDNCKQPAPEAIHLSASKSWQDPTFITSDVCLGCYTKLGLPNLSWVVKQRKNPAPNTSGFPSSGFPTQSIPTPQYQPTPQWASPQPVVQRMTPNLMTPQPVVETIK